MNIENLLLNHLPKYETHIPSTKESVWFRPLLVKEEKKLLQITEFGTYKEKINAFLEVLESCFNYPNIRALSMVDIQYLFLQLRIKSIGSHATPSLVCPTTKELIKLDINLEDIQVIFPPSHNNWIDLKHVKIYMTEPSLDTILSNDSISDEESIYESILSCLKEIHTVDEIIDCKTIPKKDLEVFLDNMTKEQFNQILGFFETMPKIEKNISYKTSDNVERIFVLRGISDFFV